MTAIDQSRRMVEIARRRLRTHGCQRWLEVDELAREVAGAVLHAGPWFVAVTSR